MIKINTKFDRKSHLRWKTTSCNQHWKGVNNTLKDQLCYCYICIFIFFHNSLIILDIINQIVKQQHQVWPVSMPTVWHCKIFIVIFKHLLCISDSNLLYLNVWWITYVFFTWFTPKWYIIEDHSCVKLFFYCDLDLSNWANIMVLFTFNMV